MQYLFRLAYCFIRFVQRFNINHVITSLPNYGVYNITVTLNVFFAIVNELLYPYGQFFVGATVNPGSSACVYNDKSGACQNYFLYHYFTSFIFVCGGLVTTLSRITGMGFARPVTLRYFNSLNLCIQRGMCIRSSCNTLYKYLLPSRQNIRLFHWLQKTFFSLLHLPRSDCFRDKDCRITSIHVHARLYFCFNSKLYAHVKYDVR